MPLGEYTGSSEIDIARRIDEVFAFVADPENDPQWVPLVPDVTPIDDSGAGHSRYRFT